MGRVVAGDVAGAVAAGGGALQLLRVGLQLRAVGARTPGQAAHIQTAYNAVQGQNLVTYFRSQVFNVLFYCYDSILPVKRLQLTVPRAYAHNRQNRSQNNLILQVPK